MNRTQVPRYAADVLRTTAEARGDDVLLYPAFLLEKLAQEEFYAYVDNRYLRMTVVDQDCEEIIADIIDYRIPRLDAAEARLAEYGFELAEEWRKEGDRWAARVQRDE